MAWEEAAPRRKLKADMIAGTRGLSYVACNPDTGRDSRNRDLIDSPKEANKAENMHVFFPSRFMFR